MKRKARIAVSAIGIVFVILAGVVLVLAFGGRRTATDEEAAEAIEAVRAFYDRVRAVSLVELPNIGNWRCGGGIGRTASGRPVLGVSADLSDPLTDGRSDYKRVEAQYDLVSREVVYFSFLRGDTRRDLPQAALDPELEQKLVKLAQEFARANGDTQYQFDYTERRANNYELDVDFDRVIHDVYYVHDSLSILVTRNGFIRGYYKKRQWREVGFRHHRPVAELLERSKRYAEGVELGDRRRTSEAKEVESHFAAGRPNRWLKPPFLRRLNGYLKPKALFASLWEFSVTDPEGERLAFVLVFVSARGGGLVKRHLVVTHPGMAELYRKSLLF